MTGARRLSARRRRAIDDALNSAVETAQAIVGLTVDADPPKPRPTRMAPPRIGNEDEALQ